MERVIDNIRCEVRNYLRDGTPMPNRDPRWSSHIDSILKEEKLILETEQIEEIEKMYANFHKKHVSGITFEEWMDKCKKLYSVGSGLVTSIALGPDHGRTWGPYRDDKRAHKKVLQLIDYKKYDHFVRGRDFAYDPESQPNPDTIT